MALRVPEGKIELTCNGRAPLVSCIDLRIQFKLMIDLLAFTMGIHTASDLGLEGVPNDGEEHVHDVLRLEKKSFENTSIRMTSQLSSIK